MKVPTQDSSAGDIEKLIRELRSLGAAFENIKAKQARTDKDKRGAIAQALIAVVKFIDAQPQSRAVDTVLLRRMIEALVNIEEHGKTTSWLLNKVTGRKAVPPKILGLRWQKSEEMDRLMKPPHCLSKEQAARKVARRITPTSTLLLGTAAYGAVSVDEIWPVVAGWHKNRHSLAPKCRG